MNKLNGISLLLFFFGLMSCSSSPQITEYPNTANPIQEIAKSENNLNSAVIRQVDVLAPTNFENAKKYLDQAKLDQNKNKDKKEILHNIAVANTYLEKANEQSRLSNEIIPKVTIERENAIHAEAPKYFPKELKNIDNDLKIVTTAIEKKNNEKAEKFRGNLAERYSKLELQTIKKEKLGMANERIDYAIKMGAKKIAPITLDWAQKKVTASDATIQIDPHNSAKVDEAVQEANMATEKLLRIFQLAKNSNELNPEQRAIQTEQAQNKLNQSKSTLDLTKAELEGQKSVTKNLSSDNAQLESQIKFENKYKEASQMFSKDEALVFRLEDSIWIRLSGLAFPYNKVEIPSDKFALLSKVQTVIQNNLPCNVTIEGHTDSVGSKKSNLKVSIARAQAVADFFIGNNIITRDRITVKGLGDANPIATNKTAEGRSLNRRVEVIITPVKTLTLQ